VDGVGGFAALRVHRFEERFLDFHRLVIGGLRQHQLPLITLERLLLVL
jgi:hypothetical protein